MKTLLVLARHPELAEAMRAALNPERYRLIHRVDLQEAEPLLGRGMLDACILDVESADVQVIWEIEKLRRRLPQCPILLYAEKRQLEWEEEAYLQGATHLLNKPVRGRMLNALLERLWPATSTMPATRPVVLHRPESPQPAAASPGASQALGVLRDFSTILTHSLHSEPLLKQFLLLIREILGVNRAAIFLRPPAFGGMPTLEESRHLRSACAMGLSPGLLEHFELSFETGIGGYLFRQGRILRRESLEIQADPDVQKEFDLLGAQVAIPMLDRETLVGVAIFDGRVTGEPLANGELELIFHLLEQLGLAVKNIWLHDQLAANHEMMADILRQLSSACIVVSRDLNILHANKAARAFFAGAARRGADLEFSDLPQALGSKVYQVLKTGAGLATFKYQPGDDQQTIYHVSIVPFQKQNSALPNSALLVVEDHTQSEQLQRLEIETANLRLVKTMADRLAHEVGNALVPLATHQQLLADKYKDPEFRASLDSALADGVKRVSRLINQMRFLARDAVVSREALPLAQLIEESYQEAQKHLSAKSPKLKYDDSAQPIILAGDRAALKHALSEVMLNALQANPADPKIGVRTVADAEGNGGRWIHIEVKDNGPGFTAEAAQKVPEPFYTTRNVGLGLGLTVCRKIVETHHGKLAIVSPKSGQAGVVRISLPIESSSAA